MPRNSVHRTVCRTIADNLSIQDWHTVTGSLNALGMDSLDRIEIIMQLEEKFGIRFSDDRYEAIKTVEDLIHHIKVLTYKPDIQP